ncbi:MAG: carboxymuconolactone decarboxylase family protein [Acidobacteria bacterium]|nr:carboxymuconolactone decarboxylase family protein [Acidobacteriota bacterium]
MRLESRTVELIAIGASYTANCQPCIEYHVGKARQLGVGIHEIADAIEVGRMVRAGATSKLDTFVSAKNLTALGEPSETRTGCGCES